MSESHVPALAVVVVSFDTRDLLERCLESVRAARPAETIVVDNGSTDGSIELVRERFPEARLLVNETNRGYGAGANQGIAASTAPAVVVLNSDTVLHPQALAALAEYLADHPQAAVVGPRLVDPHSRLQRSTYPFPSAADTLLGESGLHLLVRAIPGLRARSLRTWSHDRARRVPWVLGAALAIRRDAWASVAGFDEAYFMYGEELDLSRRLATVGYETHYAPVTTVMHVGAASTRRRPVAMRREFVASLRRYLARHESRSAAIRVLTVLRLIMALRLLRDAARLGLARDEAERARLRAMRAGTWSILSERGLWWP
ncbi:MAG TPA: glycosyltransferase family 2 protein [Solirubrobacteraceae bacterium]|nr:glycosyltransferase family 2 protein [Solirubrobacteraceae bacterium]